MGKSICIIKNGYFDNPRVFRDANTLSSAGYNVDVVCMNKGQEKIFEKTKNLNIYRIPLKHRRGGTLMYVVEYSIFLLSAFILISLLFTWKRYLLVEAINVPDSLVFTAIIPKIFGAKIVLAMPEPAPELFIALGKKSRFIKNILKHIQLLSCKFSDLILPVTSAMKDYLAKQGIPKKKMIVILNVPDDSIFDADNSLNNHTNGTFNLIYSGSILKRFGLGVVISSFPYLIKEIPNIKLDVYGTGEFKSEAEALVRELKLESYIKFHGFINFKSVPEVIKNTTVCLVPILKNDYSELVQTHKMYESISCGKPVVITRINSFLECFDENQVSYFESGNNKDLADKIIELYKYPDKRIEMAEKAFCQFQKYKWQNAKIILLNVIAKLIDAKYEYDFSEFPGITY